jgi:hypothetical protein
MGTKRPKAGANPRGKRRPVSGDSPNQRKRPIPGAPITDDPMMVWGFAFLDLDGPWGWTNLTPAQAKSLYGRMCGWEKQRPGELFGATGNKPIALDKLCPEAQKRLHELELDDQDRLWELRVSGQQRVWGARQGHVFYLLWWDAEHTVCPSLKKHT